MRLTEEVFKGIGNRARKRRQELDLTLKEVGEKCNLTRHTVMRFEKGYSRCSLDTFLKICIALESTPDEILVKDKNPYYKSEHGLW